LEGTNNHQNIAIKSQFGYGTKISIFDARLTWFDPSFNVDELKCCFFPPGVTKITFGRCRSRFKTNYPRAICVVQFKWFAIPKWRTFVAVLSIQSSLITWASVTSIIPAVIYVMTGTMPQPFTRRTDISIGPVRIPRWQSSKVTNWKGAQKRHKTRLFAWNNSPEFGDKRKLGPRPLRPQITACLIGTSYSCVVLCVFASITLIHKLIKVCTKKNLVLL